MRFLRLVSLGIGARALRTSQWETLKGTAEELLVFERADAAFRRALRGADGLVVELGEHVSADMLDAAPRLRYIGVFGTGYGGVDIEAAGLRGVAVTNIPDYATDAVAELTIAAVLADLRGLHEAHSRGRRGSLDARGLGGQELRGKRVGVVGLGRIGGRVAQIAKEGFGADVTYWSRTRRLDAEAKGVHFAVLDELLARCDVVSLHLALDRGTRRIMNSRRLARVKTGALLVSFAPVGLIDLTSLQAGIERGAFRFICDHGDELSPQRRKALSALSGCVLYPPIGYATREAAAVRREVLVANVEGFLSGNPRNVVNVPVGGTRPRKSASRRESGRRGLTS